MNKNHTKSIGMSLILHPQKETIHLRPTSELVTQTVGACLQHSRQQKDAMDAQEFISCFSEALH